MDTANNTTGTPNVPIQNQLGPSGKNMEMSAITARIDLSSLDGAMGMPLDLGLELYKRMRIADVVRRGLTEHEGAAELGVTERSYRRYKAEYLDNESRDKVEQSYQDWRGGQWGSTLSTGPEFRVYHFVKAHPGKTFSLAELQRGLELPSTRTTLDYVDAAVEAGLLEDTAVEVFKWTGKHHNYPEPAGVNKKMDRAHRAIAALELFDEQGGQSEKVFADLTNEGARWLTERLLTTEAEDMPFWQALKRRDQVGLEDTAGSVLTFAPVKEGDKTEDVADLALRHAEAYASDPSVSILPSRGGLDREGVEKFLSIDFPMCVEEIRSHVKEATGKFRRGPKKTYVLTMSAGSLCGFGDRMERPATEMFSVRTLLKHLGVFVVFLALLAGALLPRAAMADQVDLNSYDASNGTRAGITAGASDGTQNQRAECSFKDDASNGKLR